MTAKPRTPRNSRPLTPGAACDAIAARRNSAELRRSVLLIDFGASEAEAEEAIMLRVPEEQRGAVLRMLAALGMNAAPQETVLNDTEMDPPSSNDSGNSESSETPRGAQPYEPGPVAAAARAKR